MKTSKGQIMAEELKNQMGERLPGSMQAAAKAAHEMGITSEATTEALFKAMEEGKLVAEDFLPVFSEKLLEAARSGGALEKAMNNTGAAIGRFQTEVWKANKEFNEAGFDKTVRDIINAASTSIQRAEPLWKMLGAASEHIGIALRGPLELFGSLGEKLGLIEEASDRSQAKLKLLALGFAIAFKWAKKLLFTFFLILPALSGISKLIDGEKLSWSEWAITLGGVALLLGGIVKKLRDAKKAIDALRGKKTPSVGDVGESPESRSQRRGGRAGGVAALGRGAVAGGAIMALEQTIQEARAWLSTQGISATGFDPNTFIGRTMNEAYPSLGRTGALTRQGQEQARQMIVNGDIRFEIEGRDGPQIADEVIQIINEQLIRPSSMNDPVIER